MRIEIVCVCALSLGHVRDIKARRRRDARARFVSCGGCCDLEVESIEEAVIANGESVGVGKRLAVGDHSIGVESRAEWL